MMLKDKVAIVTGAARGLGEAIARAYACEGARLLLVDREAAPVHASVSNVPRQAEQCIEVLEADVSNISDVDRVRARALHLFGGADILVNNAGVYGPIGSFADVDWQEWCDAVSVNLLGTVAMCRAIVPLMVRRGRGKIINLSGGGATAPMPNLSAYAASKAAVVRFTETIAHELVDRHIDVNALAPGALNTRMLDQVLQAGPEGAGQSMYERSLKQLDTGGASIETAAELAVFLASEESDEISGRLISAVWDDWRTLPRERHRIQRSDVFTLRRIVPEDRGWDEDLS